ncbi:hypothetical protein PR001_g11462 [Phytophthora rubi]|uniref:RxLR effector protein n=1 Tax=Phytophthora rubi TaxID=129364 RepID=A0A6A3M0F8_9STRA|nr:hypothetical protein PR002_g11583 [Phytophthora rubi]KAE9029653.1 hypothetical protein PR001_g11462 [Phytophthora rubi]
MGHREAAVHCLLSTFILIGAATGIAPKTTLNLLNPTTLVKNGPQPVSERPRPGGTSPSIFDNPKNCS